MAQLLYISRDFNISISSRLDVVPKNMHTIVKEIFKMAVCIKPRLIRQGFQMMDTLNATQDTFEQMNRLLDHGKFK